MSGSMSVRALYSFSVSMMWSATTASVMPDSVTRYDSAERPPSCQYSSRLQHPLLDALGLARVETGLLGRARRAAVDVLAVLAVEQLAVDRDRGIGVEHRDLEPEDREVLLFERDQPVVFDEHLLARRRGPPHAAAQDAGAHVEHALVLADVGDIERQRLVVDVDAHDLGVGALMIVCPTSAKPYACSA